MQATVKKWGNSAAVRIPAAILEAARLTLNAAIDVREEGGRIVIEPVRTPEAELDDLVNAITADNLHSETDFGAPVGNEVW